MESTSERTFSKAEFKIKMVGLFVNIYDLMIAHRDYTNELNELMILLQKVNVQLFKKDNKPYLSNFFSTRVQKLNERFALVDKSMLENMVFNFNISNYIRQFNTNSRPVFQKILLQEESQMKLKKLFFKEDGSFSERVISMCNMCSAITLDEENTDDVRYQVHMRNKCEIVNEVRNLLYDSSIVTFNEEIYDVSVLIGGTMDQTVHYDTTRLIATNATDKEIYDVPIVDGGTNDETAQSDKTRLTVTNVEESEINQSTVMNELIKIEINRKKYNEIMESEIAPSSIILDTTNEHIGIQIGVLDDFIEPINGDENKCRIKKGKIDESFVISRKGSVCIGGRTTSVIHDEGGCGIRFAGDFLHYGVKNVQTALQYKILDAFVALPVKNNVKNFHSIASLKNLNEICRLFMKTKPIFSCKRSYNLDAVGRFDNNSFEADYGYIVDNQQQDQQQQQHLQSSPNQAMAESETVETKCVICLKVPKEDVLAKVDGCSHLFCFHCISEWAKTKKDCPLCKVIFSTVTLVQPPIIEIADSDDDKNIEQQHSQIADSDDDKNIEQQHSHNTRLKRKRTIEIGDSDDVKNSDEQHHHSTRLKSKRSRPKKRRIKQSSKKRQRQQLFQRSKITRDVADEIAGIVRGPLPFRSDGKDEKYVPNDEFEDQNELDKALEIVRGQSSFKNDVDLDDEFEEQNQQEEACHISLISKSQWSSNYDGNDEKYDLDEEFEEIGKATRTKQGIATDTTPGTATRATGTEPESGKATTTTTTIRKSSQGSRFNSHVGSAISNKSILTLEPQEWLDDEIIDRFIEILLHRSNTHVKNSAALPCYSYTLLTSGGHKTQNGKYDYNRISSLLDSIENLTSLRNLFIPVNIGRKHWILVTVQFLDPTILYFDSLCSYDGTVMTNVKKMMQDYYKLKNLPIQNWKNVDMQPWRDIDKGIPLQTDGHDCGVYVCMAVESILLEKLDTIYSINSTEYRVCMKQTLCSHTSKARTNTLSGIKWSPKTNQQHQQIQRHQQYQHQDEYLSTEIDVSWIKCSSIGVKPDTNIQGFYHGNLLFVTRTESFLRAKELFGLLFLPPGGFDGYCQWCNTEFLNEYMMRRHLAVYCKTGRCPSGVPEFNPSLSPAFYVEDVVIDFLSRAYENFKNKEYLLPLDLLNPMAAYENYLVENIRYVEPVTKEIIQQERKWLRCTEQYSFLKVLATKMFKDRVNHSQIMPFFIGMPYVCGKRTEQLITTLRHKIDAKEYGQVIDYAVKTSKQRQNTPKNTIINRTSDKSESRLHHQTLLQSLQNQIFQHHPQQHHYHQPQNQIHQPQNQNAEQLQAYRVHHQQQQQHLMHQPLQSTQPQLLHLQPQHQLQFQQHRIHHSNTIQHQQQHDPQIQQLQLQHQPLESTQPQFNLDPLYHLQPQPQLRFQQHRIHHSNTIQHQQQHDPQIQHLQQQLQLKDQQLQRMLQQQDRQRQLNLKLQQIQQQLHFDM